MFVTWYFVNYLFANVVIVVFTHFKVDSLIDVVADAVVDDVFTNASPVFPKE